MPFLQVRMELGSHLLLESSTRLSHPGPPLVQLSGPLQLHFLIHIRAICLLFPGNILSLALLQPWSQSLMTSSNHIFDFFLNFPLFVFVAVYSLLLIYLMRKLNQVVFLFFLLLPLQSQTFFFLFFFFPL